MARRPVALALAAAGLLSFAWGILQGDLQVALVLIVPVVYGSSVWGFLGIALLAAAFLVAASGMTRAPPSAWREAPGGAAGDARAEEPDAGEGAGSEGGWRGAGVVMLGPIPVAFGNDRSLLALLMVLALLLLAAGVLVAWGMG